MLAFSKTKCSKTLAFPVMYYEVYRSAMQSVELFCAYLKSNIAFVYTYLLFYKIFIVSGTPCTNVQDFHPLERAPGAQTKISTVGI